MTKPSKSKESAQGAEKPSDTSGAVKSEQAAEAPKLKKEAAIPGTVVPSETKTGQKAASPDQNNKPAAVESTLVGKSSDGSLAAAPKPSRSESINPVPTGAGNKPSESRIPVAGATIKPGTDSTADKIELKQMPDTSQMPNNRQSEKPAQPAPVQNVTVRKTGFWPVFFGGIVAAGLGSAATIWALPHLPAGWLPEAEPQETVSVDTQAITADAVAAAERAAREMVAAETAKLSETASQTGSADPDFSALMAEQTERIAALESNLASNAPGDVATAPAPGDSTEPLAETTAAPEDSDTAAIIADLQRRVDELTNRPTLAPEAAAKIQSLAENADTLAQEISSAQEETAKLQAAAAAGTKRAEAVAAVAALQQALENGVTPADAQQSLEAAGIDAPEALQKEIASIETLQSEFAEASRAALRATLRNDSAEGGGNIVTNFLRAQTGARSVTPREGEDPDAILSRANAKVESGDISGAIDEMAPLPEVARSTPQLADWLTKAQAYRDAQAALFDLSAASN